MLNFSPGLNLTWQIFAGEAAYINHQFIEKGQILKYFLTGKIRYCIIVIL